MASVGSVNRFSAIELDDDGNIVKAPAQPSNNSQKNDKEEKQSNDKKSQNQQGKKNNQPQANQAAEQQNQNNNEHHDQTRNRVSDRNRRGRGGVSSSQSQGPEGGANGFAPRGGRGRGNFQHRGGYIQDGEKREFDRRSGPHTDRPRGRARKGGMGLGRYSEEDSNRRNRPNRNVEDPTANDQEETQTQPDATQTTEETQASTDNQSTGDNQVAPDSEAAVVASEEIDLSAVVPVEEEDSTLTYDQFVEQKKAKVLADDLNRQLRAVEINDKQWKKVSTAVAPKKKKILLPTGVEVEVDDNSSEKVASEKNSADKKKKVLSLDEFVGTATNTVPISSNNDNRPGPNGGNGGARGGRGRGGRGNGRGGRGGRGRGGLRGPSVAIDDRKAFPDLSAAKKN